MQSEIVLNELSVKTEHCAIGDRSPREIINAFVELLNTLMKTGKVHALVATARIYSFQITPGYGIEDWLKDPTVKKIYKQFFRSACSNRCSYINPDNYGTCEFQVILDGTQVPGIGCLAAYRMGLSALSAQTNRAWEDRTIAGRYSELDAEGGLSCAPAAVDNLSCVDQIAEFDRWNLDVLTSRITSGQDLWENRAQLYAHLQFCENVRDQLYQDPERFHILQIMRKLKRMNEYFSTYNGVYDPKELGLGARTESQTVKETPELKRMRRFVKPDGTPEYFFDHIGFTGKYCGRIYFFPDGQTRTGIIGYIGKHLKTDRFNP